MHNVYISETAWMRLFACFCDQVKKTSFKNILILLYLREEINTKRAQTYQLMGGPALFPWQSCLHPLYRYTTSIKCTGTGKTQAVNCESALRLHTS